MMKGAKSSAILSVLILGLTIHSLNETRGIKSGTINKVSILGDDQELTWDQGDDGLVIHMQEIPDMKYAITFRIETNNVIKP